MTDRTNHYSRALASIVNELDLRDVWYTASTNKGYTHYASKTTSRLDRIYVTKYLRTRKTGVETIATAVTDHIVVVLPLAIATPLPLRGRGYWKMNVSLLQDAKFMSAIKTQWTRWQQHKGFYPITSCGGDDTPKE